MAWTHGISGYVNKCRCEVCKTAHRRYQDARNQRRYDKGQCRHCAEPRRSDAVLCGLCLADARDYQRERLARRRQTQEAAA